jgi:hypothetical protein
MSESSSGLVDIVEPAVPVLTEGVHRLWISAAVAILISLLFVLMMLWKKWPAYLALKRLRNVKRQIKSGELTPHEGVLMLALELRHGLGMKRLLAAVIPTTCSEQDSHRWVEYMHHLDELLYQHGQDVDADKLAAVFGQAEYWLQRYSRRTKLMRIVN